MGVQDSGSTSERGPVQKSRRLIEVRGEATRLPNGGPEQGPTELVRGPGQNTWTGSAGARKEGVDSGAGTGCAASERATIPFGTGRRRPSGVWDERDDVRTVAVAEGGLRVALEAGGKRPGQGAASGRTRGRGMASEKWPRRGKSRPKWPLAGPNAASVPGSGRETASEASPRKESGFRTEVDFEAFPDRGFRTEVDFQASTGAKGKVNGVRRGSGRKSRRPKKSGTGKTRDGRRQKGARGRVGIQTGLMTSDGAYEQNRGQETGPGRDPGAGNWRTTGALGRRGEGVQTWRRHHGIGVRKRVG